ncbi:MAG: AbrB/MazE/SpoVT family DNA-binding domain-containing protein [Clostridia bacterium]|jgi:AbrB family transcriptional regulator (stage V sporulation protein T)|nr:AbrB/MazE/SpoVT family DNA-binding domain-containing protein [Clostridia bacterium]
MKATGIVRRIDDLGRVVIPKEIRRTMRIREGDPLEIYTDADGEVIFKKYSPIGELGPYTQQYADVLSRTTGLPALLCDRDRVIAAAGVPKKEVLGRAITPELEARMEARAPHTAGEGDALLPFEGCPRALAAMFPIIGGGDVMGAVMVLQDETSAPPTPTQQKLVQIAAGFLGKQMEE